MLTDTDGGGQDLGDHKHGCSSRIERDFSGFSDTANDGSNQNLGNANDNTTNILTDFRPECKQQFPYEHSECW